MSTNITDTGSTVPRRQLGRELRRLRERAGMTVEGASQILEWSRPKLWRVETGKSPMRSHDAELMCRVYGADAKLTEALAALAKETKSKGWWHSYGDVIPEWFEVYVGLEAASCEIREYQAELVPGLLQTKSYARMVQSMSWRDPEDLDRRVELRMSRQALLRRRAPGAPSFQAVISEAVLRRPVGSRELMAEQLTHLAEIGAMQNVSVRVLPFSAGLHRGMPAGAFITLRFPADREPPTVYIEEVTGSLYLDKPTEFERYDVTFKDVVDKSLDDRSSAALLAAAAKEFS